MILTLLCTFFVCANLCFQSSRKFFINLCTVSYKYVLIRKESVRQIIYKSLSLRAAHC